MNDIRDWRSLPSQSAIVVSNGSFRRSSAMNFARARLANDERASGARSHGDVWVEFFGEQAGTKRPVSSHVDPPEEYD